MLLSIIIPIRNTILKLLDKIDKLIDIKKREIIDDFSNDGTRELLKNLNKSKYKFVFMKNGGGKGSKQENQYKLRDCYN